MATPPVTTSDSEIPVVPFLPSILSIRISALTPSCLLPPLPPTPPPASTPPPKCPKVSPCPRYPTPIFFTHSNPNPNNILINPPSFRTSALVDKECAGFYPDDWEKIQSLYSKPGNVFWKSLLQRVIFEFEDKMKIEM
ncbi:uncharacterized protein EAE98_005863 [Botrytis deweyae]|uniref:Uncharacterized protein n=1 Tax=Botrytis deweyae TaxID=2478750 RepID=A0ABQ7IL07_9HELO|nr:uncharacterized protein EAE98_005863 [Botrytis deweyae]KAF7927481.1 hypothetical protein EAE98_005863 [Botrytis deweyae]